MDTRAVQLKRKKAGAQPPQNGFERGLVAERILRVGELHGIMYYLVQWTDRVGNAPELLSSEVVKSYIPQMIIDFLEEKLNYNERN